MLVIIMQGMGISHKIAIQIGIIWGFETHHQDPAYQNWRFSDIPIGRTMLWQITCFFAKIGFDTKLGRVGIVSDLRDDIYECKESWMQGKKPKKKNRGCTPRGKLPARMPFISSFANKECLINSNTTLPVLAQMSWCKDVTFRYEEFIFSSPIWMCEIKKVNKSKTGIENAYL